MRLAHEVWGRGRYSATNSTRHRMGTDELTNACGLNCDLCPAVRRCGKKCNYCRLGAHRAGTGCGGCLYCPDGPLFDMDIRRRVMEQLGGLDLTWPRDVVHPELPELPVHLPVLVQAYADPVDVPWIAIHGGRLLGVTGRQLTPKHRRSLREVYRLAPETKLALEFYVEDRVLEGLWTWRRRVIQELASVRADLILAPNFSVWFDQPRFASLVQIRKAFIFYMEMVEAGLPAVADISFYLFEPDGRVWAEWVNSQPTLRAVSLFCGGKKVHASKRHLRDTLEDIALFHQAVRPDVAFILGGIHASRLLTAYRAAAPGRRLVFCNGMAYALAQRRKLLTGDASVARSARDCFLLNCATNDRVYGVLAGGMLRIARKPAFVIARNPAEGSPETPRL